MTVLVANNSGGIVHFWAGKFPGQVGWIISPGGWREPRAWLPYSIDNGKYACWENESDWNEDGFFALLDRCNLCKFKPRWITVPDEVADKHTTLDLWAHYEPALRRYGWPLAFVVQDGMTPFDVPKSADLVFIGGTTEWKWRNAALFVAAFPRVHIGRVNNIDKIEFCERLGVESCDGTGFFRDGEGDLRAVQLEQFFGGRRRHREQPELWVRSA